MCRGVDVAAYVVIVTNVDDCEGGGAIVAGGWGRQDKGRETLAANAWEGVHWGGGLRFCAVRLCCAALYETRFGILREMVSG